MDKAKPFCISKREVWEAYRQVKANRGAAGVDGQSLKDFEADLKNKIRENAVADLHLNLKGEYFDQVKAGTKPWECRLASKWPQRLAGKSFDRIFVKRGYPKSWRHGTDRGKAVAWI